MFKPFKPPLLKKIERPVQLDLTASGSEPEFQHRPSKKRKLLIHHVDAPAKTQQITSQAANAPRKPLLVVKTHFENKSAASAAPEEGPEGYYMVLWYD